jgi:hypothetical protein
MTLPVCASPCACAAALGSCSSAERLDNGQNDPPPWSDELPENDEWEEFDPTPLEEWILDDFEWEIEQPWPQRCDYWDDSLDGEWDMARQMTNDQAPMTKNTSWPFVIGHWDLVIGHSSIGGPHDF